MKKETLVVLGFLVLVVGYGLYDRTQMTEQFNEQLAAVENERVQLENRVTELVEDLDDERDENEDLREALEDEQDRLQELGEEVERVTGTISDLERLAELDEELLKKYSKVAFLNENYLPRRLTDIREKYLYDENSEQQILKDVEDFLEDLMEDADDDDVVLWIKSAYRSFGTQAQLKGHYLVTYGSGANAFSADQGYSEHQLGTTVDFTTEGMNGALTTAFGDTEAFEWLQDNAYKYGFILSYPPGNAYYQYEPWHWRFVGRDLAKDLNRSGKNFYDLDQREIDDYLLEIFD